jgi:uncharacterized membrane protein
MEEKILLLGFGLIFIGMLIIIIFSLLADDRGKDGTGYAVGGFIGPIPFGFASEKPLLYAITIVSVAVSIMFLWAMGKGFFINKNLNAGVRDICKIPRSFPH